MVVFTNFCDVIVDLHERGFTEDFEVNRKGIVWIQEHVTIGQREFLVTECYRFLDRRGNEIVICAIVSPLYKVKGILLMRNLKYARSHTAFMERKIAYLSSVVADHKGEKDGKYPFNAC